jgi:hypothetical protein
MPRRELLAAAQREASLSFPEEDYLESLMLFRMLIKSSGEYSCTGD